MKIAIADWQRLDNTIGGCEVFFEQLGKALNAEIVDYKRAQTVLGYTTFPNKYYRYAIADRTFMISEYFEKLAEIGMQPDVIIANDGVVAWMDTDIPVISVTQNTCRDVGEWFQKTASADKHVHLEFDKFMGKLQRDQIARSIKNVCVSNYALDYCKKWGLKAKVPNAEVKIELGINPDIFKPMNKKDLREKYEFPLDKKIGIWAGSFNPIAGYHIVQWLVKQFPDIFWILVFKHTIDNVDRTKLKNVKVFCERTQAEMAELYNCADFFVLPTPIQSFGLVATEAAACDLPIITNRKGIFWDWQPEKVGIFPEEYDGPVFADAVRKVVQGNLNFEPRKTILERGLTMDRCVKEWKDLITRTAFK